MGREITDFKRFNRMVKVSKRNWNLFNKMFLFIHKNRKNFS